MTEAWGLTIGASLLAGVWLDIWAIPLVLGSAIVLQFIRGKHNLPVLVVASIAVVVGVLRGAAAEVDHTTPLDLHLSQRASGEVVTIPRASSGGIRTTVRVSEVWYDDGGGVPASFTALVWLSLDTPVSLGDRLSIVWSVEPVERLPPGYGRFVESQGASASGRAWNVTVDERHDSFTSYLGRLQEDLTAGLRDVIPGDAGSLAAGIVTGNDASLSDAARNAFLRTGTTHITAVSGSNVAMVLALWNVIVYSHRTRRALLVQIAIVVTICLYAVLVGLEPSAVRAAIVASAGIFAVRFGRPADPLTILMLTVGGMAFWNPNYTRMIGFWLSVVSSFAIVSRMPASGGVTFRSAMLGISHGVILAQVATLPLVLLTFGTWSFSSVLANLLLVPMMMLAFPVTFFAAVTVLTVPSIAPVIAWLPAMLLDVVLVVVHRLSPLVSSLDVEGSGTSALLGIGVTCGLTVISASRDAERWAEILAERWPASLRSTGMMMLAPMVGIAIGIIAAILA